MVIILRSLVIAAFLLAFATPSLAQITIKIKGDKDEDWIDDSVIPKRPIKMTKFWSLTKEGKLAEFELTDKFPVVVEADDGMRLRINNNPIIGYVLKDDFITVREAKAYFTGRIDSDPTDAHAYKYRGQAYLNAGNTRDAIRDFTTLIKLDPNDPVNYELRIAAWKQWGKIDPAIRDYGEVMRLRPKDIWACCFRAELRLKQKDYAGMVEDYTAAIKIKPDYGTLYFQRATAYRSLKAFDKQIADCDVALKLMSDPEHPYLIRGLARVNLSDFTGGFKDVEESMKLVPEDLGIQYVRACLLLIRNDAGCCQSFSNLCDKNVLKNKASMIHAYAHLAALQSNDRKLAKKALDIGVSSKETIWPTPLFRYLDGGITKEEAIEQANSDSEKTEAHCAIGVRLLIKGERESARKLFEWVKDQGDPSCVDYTIAVGMLARMEKDKAVPKEK